MLGEFYTEVARHVCCWANSVVPWRSPCASWRAMAAPRCSRGPWPGLSALFVLGLWCWASFVAPTGRVVPASTFDDGGDGGLHDTKPSCGVSPACRTLMSCNSPNRVAVRSELEVVRRSKCGPSRRKVPNMGCCGRRGPRCGHIGACHSALLARGPAIANGNPLSRTLTP